MMRFALLLALPALALAGCRSAGAPAPTATPSPSTTVAAPADQRPRTVQPGAPGEPTREVVAADTHARILHTDADIAFMQGMIGHHRQALEMVELLKTRTEREDMRLLGLRIEVSQQDEIRFMTRWLRERGADVPSEHAHHMPGGMMPGMLTAEEMAALAAARGTEFDRLFLEGMIKHHGGALVMVDDLFREDGAGQEATIYAFASDVVADQQMEIDRMALMLRDLK